MRLDKFLKVSRLIKRRSVAKEVAVHEKIVVNGESKKPSYSVKIGDQIEITYFHQRYKIEVVNVPEKAVSKEESSTLYRLIEEVTNG